VLTVSLQKLSFNSCKTSGLSYIFFWVNSLSRCVTVNLTWQPELFLQEHEACDFSLTHNTPDSRLVVWRNLINSIEIFVAFQCNIKHAPSEKNTSFQSFIFVQHWICHSENFHYSAYYCSAWLFGLWYFFTILSVTFLPWGILCSSTASEPSVFSWIHFHKSTETCQCPCVRRDD